jgi:PAS domain S-box-containing protein
MSQSRGAVIKVLFFGDDEEALKMIRAALSRLRPEGPYRIEFGKIEEVADLAVVDLDLGNVAATCDKIKALRIPLLLILPSAADFDFDSCSAYAAYGFVRRAAGSAEAGAVLAAVLRLAEDESRRRQESAWLRTVANASPDLLLVIDEDGRYREVFTSEGELLYQESARLIGRTIAEIFPSDFAVPFLDLVRKASMGLKGGTIEYQLDVIGGRRWFEGRAASAGVGPDGKRLVIFISRDTTAHKEAAEALLKASEEKTMLFRELQHRVKNNLAMISSFISLESSHLTRADDREAFARVQDRIGAMGLIYAMLSRSEDVLDVELGAYLGALMRNIRGSYLEDEGRIELVDAFAEARLDIKRAVNLGIILNELVMNCIKYAFPGGRRGHIDLSLEVEGADLVLTLEDDGVGIASVASPGGREGTGLRLVGLLVDQLDGRLERGSGAGGAGLRFRLIFPARRPADPSKPSA